MKSAGNLDRLRSHAKKHGGFLLSPSWISWSFKYQWRCKNEHEWFATASNSLTNDTWCMACSGRQKLTLSKLREHAKMMGGECTSTVYKNVDSKYNWRCRDGHEWIAEASNVLHGKTWCPTCSANCQKSIDVIQSAAAKFGGRCLSKSYLGMLRRYEFECKEGHQWSTFANNVVHHGHWCRRCRAAHHHSKPEGEVYAFVLSRYPDAVQGVSGLLPSKRLEFDVFIPSLKKAIEFDGQYWHASSLVIERDRRKDVESVSAGISLLRVKESDYIRDPTACFLQIEKFLADR